MYTEKTAPNYHGIALIIPARNEALSLPKVLSVIPQRVTRVIVVDNGSTDNTCDVAQVYGAQVVFEPLTGYGNACLAGIAALTDDPPGIVAFADGDGSDGVENLGKLLQLILSGNADLALARRAPDVPQAMTLQQRFGNWLVTRLIHLFWGHNYHDLGPMRAISWSSLQKLHMTDRNFGWTVEMQIRALKAGLRVIEVSLPYYARIAGESKVSRSLSGVVRAGTKIFWVIGCELCRFGIQKYNRNKQ